MVLNDDVDNDNVNHEDEEDEVTINETYHL